MIRFLLLVTLAGLPLVAPKTYHGYKVLRTQALTQAQSQVLRDLELTSDYDFWQHARPGGSADIMSDMAKLGKLENTLKSHDIGYTVMIEDVERTIKESQPNPVTNTKLLRPLEWKDYYSHSEINAFLENLASESEFIEVESIGKSFEGRDMKVIQITKAGPGKPNIWIEAGIHAREWIAPAVATYLINELLSGDTDFIDKLNFHILPSANPDGYEYTRTTDRMWRKTRSDTESFFGCKGVDPNRNFDFKFGVSGVSDNKCAEVYPGETPFSEEETKNIRDYVSALKPTPILAHSLHSYSQLWLSPYGYDYNAFPDNYEEIKELGDDAVAAIESVHGKKYTSQNSADLYPASGAADDWYKAVLGARFSYTTELRDTGRYGFVLPPNQIIPTGQEIWAAFKVVLAKMVELSE